MWTSHGPTLGASPESWTVRVAADCQNRHPFRGGVYTFDESVAMRADEWLDVQSSLAEREKRHAGCQAAIAGMAERGAAQPRLRLPADHARSDHSPRTDLHQHLFSLRTRTARRCVELGRAVGRALQIWPGNKWIAIFGSGGMSHLTIDERYLQAGTSELKTWIAGAGALFDTPLQGDVIGYEPCYRSEAGTGTANGFGGWS
jgi:hypothetical protein